MKDENKNGVEVKDPIIVKRIAVSYCYYTIIHVYLKLFYCGFDQKMLVFNLI